MKIDSDTHKRIEDLFEVAAYPIIVSGEWL